MIVSFLGTKGGTGTTTLAVNGAADIRHLTQRSTVVVDLTGATSVSIGGSHACAVLASGRVRCWGDNTFGQLGDGTQTRRLVPWMVIGFW